VTSAEPLSIEGAGVGTPAVGAVNFSGAGTLSGTVAMSADSTVQVAAATMGRIGGIVSGDSRLTKIGAGTLELTATNTYLGGTTISAGTLSVGAGSTTGEITGDVTNNANITFNRSDSQSFAGIISGSGMLTKLGADTLTLTGNNTYSGGTTISAGTLRIGAGSNAGAIAGNVTNNATLTFNRSDAVTFAGTISGTGAVTKSGSNTLTLTSNSTYSGATTISGGSLVLQNNAPSTSSSGFGGVGTLRIEPAVTSFSSAWSTSGFSFGGTLTGLTLGKSGKEPVLAVRYISTEKFAGGILATTNQAAAYKEAVNKAAASKAAARKIGAGKSAAKSAAKSDSKARRRKADPAAG
jgi:autotransporter-associated beta strand protein